ncbi:MAG TPA: ABC transporter permease subunit [Acidimicrobiales bacterium]|nr:ABC transporter permease subunit [Acidimicrobiales bacterium]
MTTVPVPVTEDATGFGEVRPSAPRPRRRRGRGGDAALFPPLRGLLPLVGLMAVWELTAPDHSPYFPPPSTWGEGLADLWRDGALLPAALATLGTFVVGLGVATALGALLGLLVGAVPGADKALGPTLEYARAMPPAAVVPLATLLIGYDGTMKVAVVTSAAVWPILLNTRAGVRQLDPVMLDMARSLRLSPVDRGRKVFLPALLPSIFLGVRVAAPVALVITLLVEILTQVRGLGALIALSQRNYQAARVYGLILVCGLLSLVTNAVVTALQTYLFPSRADG